MEIINSGIHRSYTAKTFFLKKHFLLLVVIHLVFNSFAQNSIKGFVTDSAHVPSSYCALALLNANDSSIVKGNVTDDQGVFTFENIKGGSYLLKFNSVGFKTGWSPTIIVDSLSHLVLDPQILVNEGIALNEVSVSVFKPIIEFKKGMVIMNIENNILSGGNTVFELLKRVPGVIIDAQNNITINGQGGVRFLINGRLQQIPTSQMVNMLMGMSGESVSTLEIIKNPPAKYDAAGGGGLINIVLKKAKLQGFSGSLSQSVSKGHLWRSGNFGSLNFKSNKLTLFSNFSYFNMNFETNNYLRRRVADSTGTFDAVSTGQQLPYRLILNFNAGAEYELSKKTTLGINIIELPSYITNTENSSAALLQSNITILNFISIQNRKLIVPPTTLT